MKKLLLLSLFISCSKACEDSLKNPVIKKDHSPLPTRTPLFGGDCDCEPCGEKIVCDDNCCPIIP